MGRHYGSSVSAGTERCFARVTSAGDGPETHVLHGGNSRAAPVSYGGGTGQGIPCGIRSPPPEEAVISQVTTHVLDSTTGRPAAGMSVRLLGPGAAGPADGPAPVELAAGTTDADGRVRALGPESLTPGAYSLVFGTGAYFAARGEDTFFPEVTVTVLLGPEHVHVPLLLSPFAYSTYRGS